MAEEVPKFVVNGVEYPVPEALTLGEMCDAEQQFGVEWGEVKTSGIRMAAALLWVAVHRVDESVTVADIKALPAEVFAAVKDTSDAFPPELAAPSEPGSGSEPSGANEPSGAASTNGSDDPESIPSPIGLPG